MSRHRVHVALMMLGLVAAVVFIYPTFAAPVTGDDRTQLALVAAQPSWSPATELARIPGMWEDKLATGRINILSLLERRAVARATMGGASVTDLPPYVINGATKAILTVVAVLALAALLRTLRWRDDHGRLTRLSTRTVLGCTAAGALVFALGSQAPLFSTNGRNGWVSYPVHTYGAILSVLGSVALVLWCARVHASGRHRVLTMSTLVALAVLTNFRYELVFIAVPLAVVALLLVPLSDREQEPAGIRAKWAAIAAHGGAFTLVFVALRLYLHGRCDVYCYVSTTPRLGVEVFPALGLNLVSSVPGTGPGLTEEFIRSAGVSTDRLHTPTALSLLVAAGFAVGLAACWFLLRSASTSDRAMAQHEDSPAAGARQEAAMLVVAAVLCLLAAVGSAAIMSLSASGQNTAMLGHLYRHSVLCWAGIGWAVLLGLLAWGRRHSRSGGVAWMLLVVLCAGVASVQLPANQRSLAADRAVNRATSVALAGLIRTDTAPRTERGGCALRQGILEEPNFPNGELRAAHAFDLAYDQVRGRPLCHEGLPRPVRE